MSSNQAHIVVGLGFGDESKGSTTDYLVRRHRASLVCRFNGGAQAAHRVVTPEGKEHVFAQFGSGTFAGASTFLSEYMLVNPITMYPEATHLDDSGVDEPFRKMYVDRKALVTTPYHIILNRLREMGRGDGRHGSCGMGIGDTVEFNLLYPEEAMRVGDLQSPSLIKDKLYAIRRYVKRVVETLPCRLPMSPEVKREYEMLDDSSIPNKCINIYANWVKDVNIVDASYLGDALVSGNVVFEGAQGVLLDEKHGFHPHTTWSTCTFENADRLLAAQGFKGTRERVGVTRAYSTRHGAGPFPTNCALPLPDKRNVLGAWQGGFRVGWLDLPLLEYAVKACGGIDTVMVSCMDRLKELSELKVCVAYFGGEHVLESNKFSSEQRGEALKSIEPIFQTVNTDDLSHTIGTLVGTSNIIESWGETAHDKHDKRHAQDALNISTGSSVSDKFEKVHRSFMARLDY